MARRSTPKKPKKRDMMRQMMPSMFSRRLLLLAVGAFVVVGVLLGQLSRLTVVEAAIWREKAEAVLVHRRLIPTARGQILDRRMRVLAVDKPGYDVCVRYPVITGDWAYQQGRRAAYRANRHLWQQIDDEQRQRLIAQYQRPFNEEVQDLWQALSQVEEGGRQRLEAQKDIVIRRVKQTASVVWARRLERRLEEEEEGVSLADVSGPIGEQLAAHALLTNVSPSSLVRVRSLIARAIHDPEMAVWGQVSIEASRYRRYPFETMTLELDRSTLPIPLRQSRPVEVTLEGVGQHLIGALRGIWKEDADRRPYRTTDGDDQMMIDLGGYLPGDRTGRWGIEKSQEDRLRGVRGLVASRLDLDQQDRREPVAGGDVVLTVDIQLQGRIQAIMDPQFGLMKVQAWHSNSPSQDPLSPQYGQPLNGVAVVLDVANSYVLAAVSMPAFSLRQLHEDPSSVWGDKVNQPFLNRPIARAYQPGSTVKPLVLAAGVTDRKIGYDQKITCAGHLDPDANDRYRCWIYKLYDSVHGPLGASEAIARSCNIYFYTMGRRLGAQRLVGWYNQLGLGKVTGCGLDEEVGGDLPDLDHSDSPYSAGFSSADAIFMAIGQGPVRWTALQAAGCYATLARGGYAISPTFVMVGQPDRPQIGRDLGLDPRGVELAMQGMADAVNRRYGTAHSLSLLDREPVFNIEGVRLYGKSGTAQGVPLWVDVDGDGRFTREIDRIAKRGDHAWVICLVQRPGSPRPDYVVAVVVEYGGSGGTVAGPVVNQILHAMRAEGYL